MFWEKTENLSVKFFTHPRFLIFYKIKDYPYEKQKIKEIKI